MHVYIDGVGKALTANGSRNDVAAAYPGYGPRHGYNAVISGPPGAHTVCIYGINKGFGDNTLLGCRRVVVGGSPYGSVDAVRPTIGGVYVAGWAIDPDTAASIDVHIYVGLAGTAITAAGAAPDVAAAYPGYGPNTGYSTTIPVAAGTHDVCAYGINRASGDNTLLGCRRVVVPGRS